MKRKAILCSIILIALVAPTFAQQKESLPEFYESEIIKVSYPFGSGLTLSVKGTTSTIGWKLSPVFADVLSQYPSSKLSFEGYKKDYRNGNIMLWSGFAGLIASTVVFAMRNSSATSIDFSDPVNIVSYSGIFAGAAVETVGAFFVSASYESLFNAVNQYNREKIKEFGTGTVQ